MTEADVLSELRRIVTLVAPDVDPASIRQDEDIRASLGIDSFDHLRILAAISERFSIAIPEEDHGSLRTLNGMVSYIRERQR